MNEDDLSRLPRKSLLRQLVEESLDALSIDELDLRVRVLEREIARTAEKRQSAASFRTAADSLFKS